MGAAFFMAYAGAFFNNSIHLPLQFIASHRWEVVSHRREDISHRWQYVSHRREVFSHLWEVVSHRREDISHKWEIVSHRREVVSHLWEKDSPNVIVVNSGDLSVWYR
ncbi:hypothetical protein Barb4_00582 [Bacteroidales bacterium Barb4]|nr:hypothetical protein Barb4_00582 [Bacteroidales bacterium Barb4]